MKSPALFQECGLMAASLFPEKKKTLMIFRDFFLKIRHKTNPLNDGGF